MSVALLSDQWHRIANLRPRLVPHIRIHRHVIRGTVWHVLEDRSATRHHRLNGMAYRVVRLFDGHLSLAQVWQHLTRELTDETPTQDEILQLVGQLNAQDLLVVDASPDAAEMLARHDKQRKQKWRQNVGNPLSIKLPLWDPDVFLNRLLRFTSFLPASVIWVFWLAAVGTALALAPQHWPDLTKNFGERLLAANNLVIAAVVFPLLKFAHEIAHGLAVVRRGGEVHEMGLMLLVLYPTPYVDASSANAFPRRIDRMRVAAAGMMAELWIAALAFLLWTAIEPGFLRSVLYNIIVVGSVTTVMFNANPLLRLDGYYMLADALGVSNLSQRATTFWQFLISRFMLGARTEKAPQASRYEQICFFLYAPLATAYRVLVTFGIAWFVAQQYFFIGVLLALWAIASGVLWPLGKGWVALQTAPRFAARPLRAWGAVLGLTALLLTALWVIPMPRHVRAQGVVWLPEEALLRARSDGFVMSTPVREGDKVAPGDTTVIMRNAELTAKVLEQEARLELAQAKLDSAMVAQPAAAARYQEELNAEQKALDRIRADVADLVLRSQINGVVRLDRAQDLPGRFLHRGDLVGHVIGANVPLVRVVLSQGESEFDPSTLRSIDIRVVDHPDQAIAGRWVRSTPKAGHELPSAALGISGGGKHVTDPQDAQGATALGTVFQFDVEALGVTSLGHLGSRAYVAFEQSPEPIGWRWWRQLRRLFLSHLAV